MATIRMLARLEFRRRWRGTIALALLVGVIGTIVLATAAGARRSDTALDRFNTYSRSSDVEMSVGFPTASQLRAFRKTPGVAAIALAFGYALVIGNDQDLAAAVPVDAALGNRVDRARVIKGRAADPNAPNEATIGEALAAQLHLKVGSDLAAVSYTQSQVSNGFSGGNPGPPAGPNVHLHVVGIVRRPLDLGIRAAAGGILMMTPAFTAKYGHRIGLYTDVLRVRTREGAAQVPAAVAAARKLWGKAQTFQVQPLGIESEGPKNAISVLTLALWIFAGIAALAGLVAIGIVLTRDVARATVDQSTLRSLGATRAQRIAAVGSRALMIAVFGAVLAGAGAIAASPLFPVGLARKADPDVGVHADWLVLAAGIALIAVIIAAIAFTAALRATRAYSPDRIGRARRRTSPVVEAAARVGMRPTATNGLRMALQSGSGDASVPVRSAFAGAVFGVAGITAVLIFAASLAHLVDTPRLYGWTFDLKTDVADRPGSVCTDGDAHGLQHAPGVTAVAAACLRDLQIDGHPISAWAIEQLRGTIEPEVVAGRAPRRADEVALGSVTLADTHKHIGDTVSVRGETTTRRFIIVGRVALPSASVDELQPLADGASFTVAGLRPLLTSDENQSHQLLVRETPGADHAALVRTMKAIPRSQNFSGPTVPVEISRLQQIGWFPTTLAALLATLALLAVGHALVTSVRRRRRELALFKTMGFRRRQVRATVAWQATTIAVVGLVVGIPIGFLVGHAVWKLIADGLGVAPVPAIPILPLIGLVIGGLVVTNLIAFFPARTAAKTRAAVALRSE